MAGRAAYLDVAAGLFGKTEGLAEAKPGAFADFLGGEERLEDRVKLSGGDADAGIGHRDRDEAAVTTFGGGGSRNGIRLGDAIECCLRRSWRRGC